MAKTKKNMIQTIDELSETMNSTSPIPNDAMLWNVVRQVAKEAVMVFHADDDLAAEWFEELRRRDRHCPSNYEDLLTRKCEIMALHLAQLLHMPFNHGMTVLMLLSHVAHLSYIFQDEDDLAHIEKWLSETYNSDQTNI